ncbi:MAG: hypothetical protein ACFE88_03380 [Candidatus Hermodarchaeota archaeon]
MMLKRNKRFIAIFLIFLTTAMTFSFFILKTQAGPYIPEQHANNQWHWEVDVGDQLYFEGEFVVANGTTGKVEKMFKDIWIYNITSIVNTTVDWLGSNEVSVINAAQCYYNVSSGELEAYYPPSEFAFFGYNSTDSIKHRIRAGQSGMPFVLPINGSKGLEVDVLAPIINETMYYPYAQMGQFNAFDSFTSDPNPSINKIHFTNSSDYYFSEGYYYDNGTLNYGSAYLRIQMGEGPMLINATMKQVFDPYITDEVQWGVNVGDEFFYDAFDPDDGFDFVDDADDVKVKITDISDVLFNKSNNGFSEELTKMVFQCVFADIYKWNGTDYEFGGNSIVGAANNFYPQYYDEVGDMVMPFIWPINIPIENIGFMWNYDTLGIWENMPFDTIVMTENGFLEFELSNSTGIDYVKIVISKTTGVAQSFFNINPDDFMFYELKTQTLVDWSVNIGDVIYYKANQDEHYDMKATIIGTYTVYANMTFLVNEYNLYGIPLALPSGQPEYQFFTYLVAELEYWDPDTVSWSYATTQIISIANIYWPVSPLVFEIGGPPMLMPEGTSSSDLSDFFDMWSTVYDDITFSTGYVLLRNTTANKELNYYFDETSGRMTMMYGWAKMPIPGEDWTYMSIYPKFYHPLTVGTNTFSVGSYHPSGITVNIEMYVNSPGGAYIATYYPMNPVNEPLPVGESFAFFDQLMTNFSSIVGNITMTIILPPSIDLSTIGFFFYAYNMSGSDKWDPAPPEFYLTSVTYNFASNSIIIEMPPFPFGLISAMAYIDSEELPGEIPGYNIFLISLMIVAISGILIRKIRKNK